MSHHTYEDVLESAQAMLAPATPQETKEDVFPQARQVWKHTRSGRYYVLVAVTSQPDEEHLKSFPRTVVYRDLDTAQTWARVVPHFQMTFEFVGDFGEQYRDQCWLEERKDLFDDPEFRSMKKAHELFNRVWAKAQEF